MIAKNRTRGRAADDGGMFTLAGDVVLLEDQAAEPIVARLGAVCDPDSPIDVEEHVLRVAAVALRAKRSPNNPYAAATL